MASREVVTATRNTRKQWSMPWNWTTATIRQFITPVMVFHKTSTINIPLKSPLPLGMITTICQVNSTVSISSLKAVCTRSTILYQLSVSGLCQVLLLSNIPGDALPPPLTVLPIGSYTLSGLHIKPLPLGGWINLLGKVPLTIERYCLIGGPYCILQPTPWSSVRC